MKKTRFFGLLIGAALLTACSQQPVQVSLRGEHFYGKYGPVEIAELSQAQERRMALSPTRPVISEKTFASAEVNNVQSKSLEAPKQTPARGSTAFRDTPIQTRELAPLPELNKTQKTAHQKPAQQPVREPAQQTQNLAQTQPKERASEISSMQGKPLSPAERQAREQQLARLEQPARKPSVQPASLPNTTTPASEHAFDWPVQGALISNFGDKGNGLYNDGVNISALSGTPVSAAAEGTVVYAGNELQGYGNLVIIRHAGGYLTAYAHLQDIAVKRDEFVQRGKQIGRVGNTGAVTRPQLHFGLRKGKKPLDPQKFLPSYAQQLAAAS